VVGSTIVPGFYWARLDVCKVWTPAELRACGNVYFTGDNYPYEIEYCVFGPEIIQPTTDDGCCHKTRLKDAPCPVGRTCPHIKDEVSKQEGSSDIIWPMHLCGLYITHNEHKDLYKTVADFIEDRCDLRDSFISEAEKAAAISLNELWTIQWFSETPLGSYTVCASTFQATLNAANAEAN